MKHNHMEQIDILTVANEEGSLIDVAYISSRIVSENIVPQIVRALKVLNEKEHHNHILCLRDLDLNRSFGVLCGLATSTLSSYNTICIETSPGRRLVIKGEPSRIGKFLDGPRS